MQMIKSLSCELTPGDARHKARKFQEPSICFERWVKYKGWKITSLKSDLLPTYK